MPDARRSIPVIRAETCSHRGTTVEQLAAAQHGVVARWQLAAAGVTHSTIENGIAKGRLLRLHRGVYAVGHAHLRREGHWLAAVLAVGPGAVLSHRDAAGLHDLRPANHGKADVTTTRRGRQSHPRIKVHHATELHPLDVTTGRGIPVTSVARTLVDLADVVPQDQLAKALAEADRRRTLDARAIAAALARTRTRNGKGHAALRATLKDHADHGPRLTRSELEDRFLSLVVRPHGLPRPRTNAPVHGHEVDALWAARRLIVELDGYAHHADKQAFQRDRTQANALTAKGFTVLRYTYEDVVHRPAHVAGELRSLLAA
jgi:very-short-patch-repair endonuclease